VEFTVLDIEQTCPRSCFKQGGGLFVGTRNGGLGDGELKASGTLTN
jgi:hypothetical protein